MSAFDAFGLAAGAYEPRPALEARLRSLIAAGETPIAVHGPPQAGKTSLVEHVLQHRAHTSVSCRPGEPAPRSDAEVLVIHDAHRVSPADLATLARATPLLIATAPLPCFPTRVAVPPLTRDELSSGLRRGFDSVRVEVEPALIELIVEQAGGRPAMCQSLAGLAWANATGRRITADGARAALARATPIRD